VSNSSRRKIPTVQNQAQLAGFREEQAYGEWCVGQMKGRAESQKDLRRKAMECRPGSVDM
jgi:hypothetical protein